MTRRLPHPINAEQELLTALIEEVRGLRADLRDGTQPSQPTPDDGPVQLTEPEPARGNPPPMQDVTAHPDVETFHTGRGWYQVPGIDKALRRDDAIAALRER